MSETTSLLDPSMLSILVTLILGLVGSAGGVIAKITQIRTKMQSITRVLEELEKAYADKKITPEEMSSIMTLTRAVLK